MGTQLTVNHLPLCVQGSLSPTYDHSRVVGIDKITQDHLDFFDTGSITFFVYAGQMTNPTEPTAMKLTTKVSKQRHRVHRRATGGVVVLL